MLIHYGLAVNGSVNNVSGPVTSLAVIFLLISPFVSIVS